MVSMNNTAFGRTTLLHDHPDRLVPPDTTDAIAAQKHISSEHLIATPLPRARPTAHRFHSASQQRSPHTATTVHTRYSAHRHLHSEQPVHAYTSHARHHTRITPNHHGVPTDAAQCGQSRPASSAGPLQYVGTPTRMSGLVLPFMLLL